jgi:putative DNA-invertase from lambdoid prophage Rac
LILYLSRPTIGLLPSEPETAIAHIAYYRVSTADQSIEAQMHAMLQAGAVDKFTKEFKDEGVSGAIPAANRSGFSKLLAYIREGDTLHVYAVDRLGRDALDVQSTVRALLDKGVTVEVHGLGRIAKGVGELILAVLAQVADMERHRIRERTEVGRDKARASLAATGLTHKGKVSMGRPKQHDPAAVVQWRRAEKASITETARHFGCSPASVKRYCLEVGPTGL